MAEAFGTVVSALSVAGCAISIANAAIKLKTLLDALKDAPNDILALIEEIELFSEILSEIDWQHRTAAAPENRGADLSRSYLPNRDGFERSEKLRDFKGREVEFGSRDVDVGMELMGGRGGMGGMEDVSKKCLERCQKANEMLLEVADGLELEARRGGLGRMKVLMGIGRMERLRQRVEGAWRLLVLVQQIYCSALARQDSMALKRQAKRIETRIEDSTLKQRVEDIEIRLREMPDPKSQTMLIELLRRELDQKTIPIQFIASSQEVSLPLPVAFESSVVPSSSPSSTSTANFEIPNRRDDLAYMQVAPFKPQNSTALISEYTSTYIDSCIALAFGSVRYRRFITRKKAAEDKDTPYYQEEIHRTNFRLPKWMTNVAYEACYKRAKFGWDFNVKTIHLIPKDSPAYGHIEKGDIQALKGMLDRREVSPNSHTDSQWDYGVPYARESLLHWAVVHGQVEIFQLLLNLGADGIGSNGLYTTPMHIATSLIKDEGYDSKPSKRREILRMILGNQYADPEAQVAPLDVRFGTPWVFAIGGPTDTIAMLNTCVYPPYREKPLEERMRDILMMSLHAPNLALLVNEEELDGAAFDISNERGTTLTHSIVQSFAEQLCNKESNKDDLDLTRLLFSKAVNTKSLHAMSSRGSPFNFFIRGTFLMLRNTNNAHGDDTFKPVNGFKDTSGAIDISDIAQSWARELVAAGFTPTKLMSHGKKLARQTLQCQHVVSYRRSNFEGVMELRIIGMQYGPDIKDWRAWVSDPWADMAVDFFADFWDYVENPWESMPGAWVNGTDTQELCAKVDRHWNEVLKSSGRRGGV